MKNKDIPTLHFQTFGREQSPYIPDDLNTYLYPYIPTHSNINRPIAIDTSKMAVQWADTEYERPKE